MKAQAVEADDALHHGLVEEPQHLHLHVKRAQLLQEVDALVALLNQLQL
jgi:hypothetical protein